MTLLEIAVVLALISIMAGAGAFALSTWSTNQRVRSVTRELADLLQIARAEAIRSSTNHVVFFGFDSALNPLFDDSGTPVWASVIADVDTDGVPDPGEFRYAVAIPPAGTNVGWGRAPGRPLVPRNLGAMMGDPFSGTAQEGSGPELASPGKFRDPTDGTAVVSWVVFAPDGTPRAMVPDGGGGITLGNIGSGDGAVYVTNGVREYALVMAPLGPIRTFQWDATTNSWR